MHPHGKKTFTNKSDPIVRNYIEDLRKDDTDHVHLARCLKRLGDGRVEVVYCIGEKGVISQVIIPGRFRGRAKHSSFVDVGSYLLIAETGVSGPAALEMIALISDLQLETINKISPIDKRVLSKENDKEAIEAGKTNEDGFEFDRSAPVVDEKDQPVNIDDI
jgi:hypothetical protein